jgi:hypothetical protein
MSRSISAGSPPETAPPVPGTVAEYERRRCAICGARYPGFGFGPPMTRRGTILWACGPHRHELEARLAGPTPDASPDVLQKSLL